MGRFYWLKLNKNLFKRHDLLDLRSIYGLSFEAIFIHLMAESIDHDGCLRYSEKRAYSPRTLAPLVSTDEKTMQEALDAFIELELIEILDDGTIRIPLAVENIGSEVDNDNANRQRRYREKRNAERYASVTPPLQNVTECVTKNNADVTDSVTKSNNERYASVTKRNESIELRDKSTEYRVKSIDNSSSSYSSVIGQGDSEEWKPKKDDVFSFALENHLTCVSVFWDYYQARNWMIKDSPIRDWRSLLKVWEKNSKGKAKANVSVMENEYTKEHIRQKEIDSLKELDDLLEE